MLVDYFSLVAVSLLFFLIALTLLLAVTGLIGWLLTLTWREQVQLRRIREVAMRRVVLGRTVSDGDESGEALEQNIGLAQQFISTLAYLPAGSLDRLLFGAPLVVLEVVVSAGGVIYFQVGATRRWVNHLEKQIYSLYPGAQITPAPALTLSARGGTVRAGRLVRRRAVVPPIAPQASTADPMEALTAALATVQQRDRAVIQLVCRPRARQLEGGSASFDVNVRIGVEARGAAEADRIFDGVAGAFARHVLPGQSSLAAGHFRRSPAARHDLIWRVPRERTACMLTAAELARLFHFPLSTTKNPRIAWRGARVAPAPLDVPRRGVLLGHNLYGGIRTPVYFAPGDRRRHLYVVGLDADGGRALLLNMMSQDIAAGRGVGVIDPQGDLVEDILLQIPLERAQDVILLDGRDTEQPLALNILEVHGAAEKATVAQETAALLYRLVVHRRSELDSPLFQRALQNALLVLTGVDGATLVDVPRLLADASFRARVLKHTRTADGRRFWEQEWQLSAERQAVEALDWLIGNQNVRNIVGQARSSFDARAIMAGQKILLCNLAQDSLGGSQADLLGSVTVAKILRAALTRKRDPASSQPDYSLYIGEFQRFVTDSFGPFLSAGPSLGVSLNVMNHSLRQLPPAVRRDLLAAVGSVVSFRAGPEEAAKLAHLFAPVFGGDDLLSLERRAAAVRLLVADIARRPFSLTVAPPPGGGRPEVGEAIRQRSREEYGRPVAQVERHALARV
jgi:hypothetical protein